MRSWVLLEPGRLELREVEPPRPQPDGIVVRVRRALTCGTDLKTYLRGHPKFSLPGVFGHEFSGEVSAVGRDVAGWREGEPVMVAPTAPCGHCYWCERDQENLCPQVMAKMVLGAYSEYVAVPGHVTRTNVYRKPDSLDFAEAALLEPLSCVVHAQKQLSLRPDDTVVLIGAGAFALLHLLLLRARGVERVIVVTRGERRAEGARRLGANTVVTGGIDGCAQLVRGASGGRGADVVIECTGQTAVWEAAPGLCRAGGTAVLFGGCPAGSKALFDTGRLHYDQVRLVSPFHFTPRDVREAYELLTGGGLGAARIISGELPLGELPAALQRLREGEGCKFALVP